VRTRCGLIKTTTPDTRTGILIILVGEDSLMEPVDKHYRFVSICSAGETTDVGGVNVWDAEWAPTDRRITVTHPSYPSQRHSVWGFYVPA